MVNRKKRRKILYIVTKSVWGGAGKYAYELAKHLPQKNFEPYVAAGGQDKLAQKTKEAHIPYFNIKAFQRNINPLKEIWAFFEIFFLIKKLRPDIVHINSSKAGGIAGLAAWFCKILMPNYSPRLIFTTHGWALQEHRPRWQKFLIRIVSKLISCFHDQIICVSEQDKKIALENKLTCDDKLTIIHNGIHTKEVIFFEKKLAFNKLLGGIPPHKTIVGTVGEFTKNKGHEYLIEAIKKIPRKIRPLTIIIGWGENQKKLEAQIKTAELEKNILLLTDISPATPYFKIFDIFVLPSLKEGLPFTLLEAGLTELPVIATNVGGNPEIIENKKTGILIPPADSKILADAIESLMENGGMRKELAKNLHEKILKEFSFEKMLEQTIKIYKEN